MNRKVLAEKSINFMIIESIGMLVCFCFGLLMLFVYISNKDKIVLLLLIMFFIIFLVSSYLTFNTLLKPKVVLEYDYNGIYIKYKKDKFIFFRDILQVYGSPTSIRYKTYRFGYLYIKTKDREYRIGVIKEVKKVEKIIVNFVNIKQK